MSEYTVTLSSHQLKDKLATLVDTLPEPKVRAVLDFAQFLAEREVHAAWMSAQNQSTAYREWVSSENDVYDEAFADDVSTR